jgi:hypothetical protein
MQNQQPVWPWYMGGRDNGDGFRDAGTAGIGSPDTDPDTDLDGTADGTAKSISWVHPTQSRRKEGRSVPAELVLFSVWRVQGGFDFGDIWPMATFSKVEGKI